MDSSYHKIVPSARWVMTIDRLIGSILTAVLLAVVLYLFRMLPFFPHIEPYVKPIIGICIFLLALNVLLVPTLIYHRYRYAVTDERIAVRSGYLSIRHDIIPLKRLQKVTVSAGPIRRLFGLASIELITAGGTLTLDFLPHEEAETIAGQLAHEINALIEAGVVPRV